jgi:DNA mismatch repair protein MutL
VDVNIHPAKREVKFRQEQAVRRVVTEAVREALRKYHVKKSAESAPIRAASSAPPTVSVPKFELKNPEPIPETRSFPNFVPEVPKSPITAWPTRDPATTIEANPAQNSPRSSESVPESPAPSTEAPRFSVPPLKPVPLLEVPLRLVGVIGRLYVVLESDRGLVLLDQHAAHERVLFEQMLERVQHGEAPSQRLLLAETIELPPRDANFLRQIMPSLTRLGVGLSEFGDRTFLLDALPPFVKAGNPKKFVTELIDALKAAGQDVNSWRLGEDVVAKTVCRHAVKANDVLAAPEIEHLVEDLRRCAMPYTCPHGRPTLIEMNYRELEKKFGRTA